MYRVAALPHQTMRSIVLFFSILASVKADDHEAHGGHGLESPYEWAGLFDVKARGVFERVCACSSGVQL